jgi:hypothetical protein
MTKPFRHTTQSWKKLWSRLQTPHFLGIGIGAGRGSVWYFYIFMRNEDSF